MDEPFRRPTPPVIVVTDRRPPPPPGYQPPAPPPLRPAPSGGILSSWWITVVSMAVSIFFYRQIWGWEFAAGFVLLILIHEFGHVVAAQRFGLRSSPPIFIPYMGALILLRDRTANAWVEAIVGIGGPLFGAIGAAVCYLVHVYTGSTFWATLAFYGFMLNLFNLAPVGFLDGGRIVTAISPWLWILGYVLMIGYFFLEWRTTRRVPQLLPFILILGLPRLFSLFQKQSPEMKRFYQIEPGQRWSMGIAYIGLIGLLILGMRLTGIQR